MNPSEPPQDPPKKAGDLPHRPVLDYHAWEMDKRERRTYRLRVTLGVILSGGLVIGAIPAVIFSGLAGGDALAWSVAALIVALIFGSIAAATLQRHRRRWRGLLMGLWIGLGLGLLVEGICFALLV